MTESESASAPAVVEDVAPFDEPVAGAERLVALDFIRGIAILGILFANITAFAHPILAYYWPGMLPDGGNAGDGWVWLFQFVAVDGKFRGLFTVLFGAGMALFMERVWARGGSALLQVRRLVWLMLFGLAHFFLLFTGDILFLYSVSGLAVLGLVSLPAVRQLVLGLVWYLVGAALFSLSLFMQLQLTQTGNWADDYRPGTPIEASESGWGAQVAVAEAQLKVMQGDSFTAIVEYRVEEQSGSLGKYLIIGLFETVPLMLIGMALFRLGLFDGTLGRDAMRRWGWAALLLGSAGSLALGLWAFTSGFEPYLTNYIFNGPSAFPRLFQILGLAALLTLWSGSASRSWLGSRLVAAGRMAFSNYIGTSLVMALVFQGWAGGLFGQLHRIELLPIVLGGWVLMLVWSKPWLARFNYGPLEWLWRCLSYWKLFPILR